MKKTYTPPKFFTGITNGDCYIKGSLVTPAEFAVEVARTDYKIHKRLEGGLSYSELLEKARINVDKIVRNENRPGIPELSVTKTNKEKKMSKETTERLDAIAAALKGIGTRMDVLQARLDELEVGAIKETLSALAAKPKKKEENETKNKPEPEEKAEAKKAKPRRAPTPEQVAKLNKAREAWFKKKGYGKYAKKGEAA